MRAILTTMTVVGALVMALGILAESFWFIAVGGAMAASFFYERSSVVRVDGHAHSAPKALAIHAGLAVAAVTFAWWWTVSDWNDWV